MKIKNKLILVALAVSTIIIGGCSLGGVQKPPTGLDRAIFNIQTNVVTVTNLVPQTNMVTVTNVVTQTNQVTGQVTTTNVVTQTNQVSAAPVVKDITNYTYTPGGAVTGTASVASTFGGPWGAVAGYALTGIAAIWGFFKSKQASTASLAAQTGQQAIATAKAVMSAMPNGAAIVDSFNSWLTQHQNDADIAAEVARIIDKVVDPHAATGAAQSIITDAFTPVAAPTGPAPVVRPVAIGG